MDNNQEEKQNYLRENILNKGYDTNEFVDYLKSKKGEEGADVANWTMEDLKQVVQEFIVLINKKTQNESIEENQSNQNIQDNPQIKVETAISTNNNSRESIGQRDEDFGIEIPDFAKCQIAEVNELNKYQKVEIRINSYKKVDKGIFTKTYFSFLIMTNPLNLNVYRRYSDFEWLKERLSVIYNTNILPRLSKKGKIVEERKINRRMRDLEKFLNYLLKDPLIKNSKIFYDFLSIDGEDDFHKMKKIYEKMKTPIEIKDFNSINGKVRINVNNHKEKYIDYIKDNAAFNVTTLNKLDQNFKALKNEMNIVIDRINSFCPLFDKLIKISTKYIDDNTTIESYKQIKILFESWAKTLKKQNSFFFIDVKEYFKFLGGNYHHIRELVQVVENLKTNYYKYSKSLIAKKIELFKKQDTSTWQLDLVDRNNLVTFYNDKSIAYKKICFKETNNAIKIKEKYGYYLNRIVSEYERMRNINAYENKDKTIQFSKKQQQILSDYIQIMGEIIGVIDGCLVENLKETEVVQDVKHEIDLNESEAKNEGKKDENKNDNSIEEYK